MEVFTTTQLILVTDIRCSEMPALALALLPAVLFVSMRSKTAVKLCWELDGGTSNKLLASPK